MTVDPHSAAWKAVRKQIDAEIEKLRTRLEKPLDPIRTESIRGEIRALRKQIKRVEEPEKPIPVESDDPLY